MLSPRLTPTTQDTTNVLVYDFLSTASSTRFVEELQNSEASQMLAESIRPPELVSLEVAHFDGESALATHFIEKSRLGNGC